eukprot:PhM_4_TR6403/c0_g2_i1/m.98595
MVSRTHATTASGSSTKRRDRTPSHPLFLVAMVSLAVAAAVMIFWLIPSSNNTTKNNRTTSDAQRLLHEASSALESDPLSDQQVSEILSILSASCDAALDADDEDTHTEALTLALDVARRHGMWLRAAATLEELIALHPTESSHRIAYVRVLHNELNRTSDALKAAEATARRHPRDGAVVNLVDCVRRRLTQNDGERC